MRSLKRLKVADKAHSFTIKLYDSTKGFPADEKYGLTSQLRRAAVSIGSNIAEGDGHFSNRVFAKHLGIALASVSEVDYQLLLAKDLGYLPSDKFGELTREILEIQAMLVGLLDHVRKRQQYKS